MKGKGLGFGYSAEGPGAVRKLMLLSMPKGQMTSQRSAKNEQLLED